MLTLRCSGDWRRLWAAIALVVAQALILSLATGPSPLRAETTLAKDARIGGDAERTRFVADLSKKVSFRVFTLADPYRVIVDMPDVRFQMPAGLGRKGKGLVTAYRYGLIAQGKSRIVIDVKAPVLVDKAFVLEARDGNPVRLVIDLAKTDRTKFLAILAKQPGPDATAKKSKVASVPLPAAAPPALRKRRGGQSKPIVVIDPGHGGVDPGAISRSGLKEKDVVFDFAKMLRNEIAKRGRLRPIMTREIDVYVPLRERVALARRNGASLFISIHADSVPGRFSRKASGATVYTLSERASDSEARTLAAKENRSDIIAGVELPSESDEVTNILIDLAQRETKNLSITFAGTLLSGLKGETPLRKKSHRFAGFRVLKAPDVPSVLVELGYISNPNDAKRLKSREWRKEMAVTISRAVESYFSKRLARVPF